MMDDQGVGVGLLGNHGGLGGDLAAAACVCSTTAAARAGPRTAACAAGAAMSAPAIAIAGAALYAVPATFCTCDGLACLPVRLIFCGRRCLCDEFTALLYSFHARRHIVNNGPVMDTFRHGALRNKSTTFSWR